MADGDRTRARPSPAVGGGEGLVHVQVDDVEAHVAGPHDPQDGVQVGAVVVEQAADTVHGFGDLDDVVLEQAERARVGEHDPGHVVIEQCAQGVEVDPSPGIGPDRDDLISAQGHRGRVGAVRGVRDDDPAPTLGLAPATRGRRASRAGR